MPKWKVTVGGNREHVVEAGEVVDKEAWVDFVRHQKQGANPPTLLVRRFRRQDVHEVSLVEE